MRRDRERQREWQRQRRRAGGVVERSVYLAPTLERRIAAKALRAEGLTQRAIAARLGVSLGAVNWLLRHHPVEHD